jgi:hypothetical protein
MEKVYEKPDPLLVLLQYEPENILEYNNVTILVAKDGVWISN